MLRARSVAVYAIAVVTALGFSIGVKADWCMLMNAGIGCSSVIVAY
jgi:hypothetical protein